MREPQPRKSLLVAFVLVLLALILPFQTSVHSQGDATAAPTMSSTIPAYTGTFDGNILFGIPLSLTGSLSNEGNQSHDGYELWKEVYNSAGGIVVGGKHYQIQTKYYDDESSAQKSATLAQKLIQEDKVNFLLGPYGTSANLQVSTIAEKAQIPMVEGNGVAESIFNQGYQYTFLVASPAPKYLLGVIDAALAQTPKPTTIAILSADDPFSLEVANSAQKYAESKGLTVVYFQKYPNNSTDLRAPLTEAKSKNPDVFLNSGHFAESVAIIQQAKELNFLAKMYGFSVGPSLPDFQTTLKNDANFVVDGTQWTADLTYNGDDLFKTPKAYTEMFVARWAHGPSYQSANSSVSGIAFVKAIQAADSLDPKAVRDALAKLDVTTFYGQIKFDDRGVNIYKPMVVEQWQNGKKVTIWPLEAASGKVLWPAPDWASR
ncbi:MAG: amino acid ABC transporter substrate-binding protein [Chloroflexota bacterium]